MALRDDIQRRIEKKRTEISQLEAQIRDAGIYVQALEDTLRMLPRDNSDGSSPDGSGATLRPGSKVDKARDAIRKAGKAMHVAELLKSLELPNNPANRAALAGSLSAYARRGEIFTRAAPNTFGLIGLGNQPEVIPGLIPEPPPNFGIDAAAPMNEGITDDDVPF